MEFKILICIEVFEVRTSIPAYNNTLFLLTELYSRGRYALIFIKWVCKKKVLLTNALRALFKVSILRNYSLKKFNTSIFDALNAQFFIKIYYLKSLNSALKTLLNIFQKKIMILQYVQITHKYIVSSYPCIIPTNNFFQGDVFDWDFKRL